MTSEIVFEFRIEINQELRLQYPLKGKLLNVCNAPLKQISENKEVQELKQILGL